MIVRKSEKIKLHWTKEKKIKKLRIHLQWSFSPSQTSRYFRTTSSSLFMVVLERWIFSTLWYSVMIFVEQQHCFFFIWFSDQMSSPSARTNAWVNIWALLSHFWKNHFGWSPMNPLFRLISSNQFLKSILCLTS